MKQALKELNQKQIEFICKECGITEEILMGMDDDELYDSVFEIMCEIEIAEPNNSNELENERYEIAADIVTLLGNALAEDDGFYDWQAHYADGDGK